MKIINIENSKVMAFLVIIFGTLITVIGIEQYLWMRHLHTFGFPSAPLRIFLIYYGIGGILLGVLLMVNKRAREIIYYTIGIWFLGIFGLLHVYIKTGIG